MDAVVEMSCWLEHEAKMSCWLESAALLPVLQEALLLVSEEMEGQCIGQTIGTSSGKELAMGAEPALVG